MPMANSLMSKHEQYMCEDADLAKEVRNSLVKRSRIVLPLAMLCWICPMVNLNSAHQVNQKRVETSRNLT